VFLNRQVAPVKSCFAGSAAPTFYWAGKNAKGRSFALRGCRKAKIEPSVSLFSLIFPFHSVHYFNGVSTSAIPGLMAKPFALLFNPAGQNMLFLASFATWRFIPKDQIRISRMILKKYPVKDYPASDPR
jgi:hypothetical protein